jgi:hypothetical protein
MYSSTCMGHHFWKLANIGEHYRRRGWYATLIILTTCIQGGTHMDNITTATSP